MDINEIKNDILSGSNGILGRYSIQEIKHNSSSGIMEVGLVFAPYVMTQKIELDINIMYPAMMEKEKRKEIYSKRKSVIKKLLE